MFKPLICLGAILGMALPAHAETPPEDDATFFESLIRPVLASKCLKCHGPARASGGLRLDSRAAIIKGGDRGPAVVPGDVGKSLLLQAIGQKEDADLRMPPGGKLPAASVADLTTWVKRGLPWPAADQKSIASNDPAAHHWAFQPLCGPVPRFARLVEQSTDCFIQTKCMNITPSNWRKNNLIRRLTFDLVGLPRPRNSMLCGGSIPGCPPACRGLLPPQYGERWGRHWMDVARCRHGWRHADYLVPEAGLYWDYIINANLTNSFSDFIASNSGGRPLASAGPSTNTGPWSLPPIWAW